MLLLLCIVASMLTPRLELQLAKNPQLKSWFVRNLNMQPNGWDIEDATLDAVVCCVSVQYMQQPEKVRRSPRSRVEGLE